MEKNNNLRLSFSSTSDYKLCPYKYKFKYVDNLIPLDQGASLSFGSAVDKGIEAILKGHLDYIDIFLQDKDRGWNCVFDDESIFYTRKDCNENILTEDDIIKITLWEQELKTTLKNALDAEKVKQYKRFNGNNLKLFNRCCWLSLLRLGILMLDSFKEKVMPGFTKIIETQKKIQINLSDTVSILGYVDLIADYKGNLKPIIFDVKTSRFKYDDNRVLLSDQLRIYNLAIKEKYGDHKVGYIVLSKTLDKEYKCDTCKKLKPSGSKAKKCQERECNGKYISIYTVNPQILIGEYTKEDLDNYLKEFINVAKLIKSGLFFRNYSSCGQYGVCGYWNLCHFNNKKGLTDKFKKES